MLAHKEGGRPPHRLNVQRAWQRPLLRLLCLLRALRGCCLLHVLLLPRLLLCTAGVAGREEPRRRVGNEILVFSELSREPGEAWRG